jgi:DNA-binding transcriptional LysR family regulator
MRPTLRQLEILTTVVEAGSFSAAGQRLGLVQPAVSLAVRKLEDGFGVTLLDRSGARLRLTAEGEALLGHAREVLGDVDRLGRHMRELRQLGTGQVTIGAPAFVSGFLLPPIVLRFLAAHPGVHVHAVEDSSSNVIARVRAGELDVGIVAGEHSFDELEVSSLADQLTVACVSADLPLARRKMLSWEQVFDEPLVLFPEGYTQRSLLNSVARRLGRTPRVICEAESANFIVELVRGGHGIAFMFAAIAEATTGIRAIPIEDGPAMPVTICRVREQVRSLAARAFYDAASESLPPRALAKIPSGRAHSDRRAILDADTPR